MSSNSPEAPDLMEDRECPECRGEGYDDDDAPCDLCWGEGEIIALP